MTRNPLRLLQRCISCGSWHQPAAYSVGFWGLVPGGGVEPPRPEGRRILSPLRLPVPPSRRFVEAIDFTLYILLCSFVTHGNECETVQESVKVFGDLHRSLSFAREAQQPFLLAKMPLGQVIRGHPSEILSPIALRINVGLAFRSQRSPSALGVFYARA